MSENGFQTTALGGGLAGRRGRIGADLVLLPDEPYVFTADDGPDAFPGVPTVLVSGRDLTWYGPSLATARQRLGAAVRG